MTTKRTDSLQSGAHSIGSGMGEAQIMLKLAGGSVATDECLPVQLAVRLIQGKWKATILTRLQNGPLRLAQLRRLLPGASKKVLTQQLREMEIDGLVFRRDLTAKTRHVEYSLNESQGFAALELIEILAAWGREHLPPQEGIEATADAAQDCGEFCGYDRSKQRAMAGNPHIREF